MTWAEYDRKSRVRRFLAGTMRGRAKLLNPKHRCRDGKPVYEFLTNRISGEFEARDIYPSSSTRSSSLDP